MARRDRTLDVLADEVASRVGEGVVKVGIDGVDGVGKTVFGDELADHLRDRGTAVLRASVDGFHHPRAVRHRRGRASPEGFYADSYDLDALRRLLFWPLADGASEVVTAIHDVHAERAISPRREPVPRPGVVVFDGIFLHRPELQDLWDVSVWLDAPFEVSIPRGAGRGYGDPDPTAASNRRYVDGQRLYIDACAPHRRATFVVDNTVLPDAHIVAPQHDAHSPRPDGQHRVRDAGSADAATVASLLNELGYPVEVAGLARRLTDVTTSTRDRVLVAERDGVVVGVCAVSVIPLLATGDWLGRITALAVTPTARRTGVGQVLIWEAEAWARRSGARMMQVSSGLRPERAAAHSFYPALGYTDSAAHHVLYARTLDG